MQENPNKYELKKMNLPRLQIWILAELNSSKAVKKLRGLTKNELAKRLPGDYIPDTVYRNIQVLLNLGYVAPGIKVGKANSYYITETGIKALEEIRNEK